MFSDAHSMPETWTNFLLPKEWHDEMYRKVYDSFMATDWLKALGVDLEAFPDALRMAIFQCFALEHPTTIYWGPSLVEIHNAGFQRTIGKGKNCDRMGRKWVDLWTGTLADTEAMLQGQMRVMNEGRAMVATDSLQSIMQENGTMLERYFDFSTIPIRDADGHTCGTFTIMAETTEKVLAKRREKTFTQIQLARVDSTSAEELFQTLSEAATRAPLDMPCVIGYHLNEHLSSDTHRTYSKVVAAGINDEHIPRLVGTKEALDWQCRRYEERDLKDYMLEVLYTRRAVRLTDPRVIATFCQRRAFGDLTLTVWLTPIFCFGQHYPAGISIQGLNPRQSQEDHSWERRLSAEIQLSIENASRRIALGDELRTRTAELAASRKRFEIMAKACPAGIYIVNLSTGKFEFVNDAYFEITGVPKDVGIERWEEYVHPEALDAALLAWSNLAAAPIYNHETRWKIPWREDIERWTSSSAIIHTDDAGISYIFGAFSDASAMRYALKIEKERADAAVSTKQKQLEFLDMIAHELRNPLGAIMQSSDFLIEKLVGVDDKNGKPRVVTDNDVEDLRTIVLCAQHMSRIINDTLNLSKLEGGMLIATNVPTQPLVVLKSVLAMFDAEAKRSGTDLEFAVDPSFDDLKVNWIQTDPSRLAQIVINLLANSIKFVSRMDVRHVKIIVAASLQPMDTRVNLNRRPSFVHHNTSTESYAMFSPTIEAPPLYLVCRISDTGPGMSEEQVTSLFQRYFQASPKTHVEYGGSGLGLFISKQLVTLLNGTIDVESVENHGTTFSFSIRTVQCEAPSQPTQSEHLARAKQGDHQIENPRDIILIAEDNLINQKILVKQLRNKGYKTLVANNGQEAIDALVDDQNGPKKIAVCLCDVEMPVMDGIEAIKEVRRMEQAGRLNGHCPFIAVTANARQEQLSEMLQAGMDATETKPLRFVSLLTKIREVLELLGHGPIVPSLSEGPGVESKRSAPTSIAASPSPSSSDTHQTIGSDAINKELTRHLALAQLWCNSSRPLSSPIDVILLNTDLPVNLGLRVWRQVATNKESLRLCADGATDRLHKELLHCALEDVAPRDRPDVVIGDLDSITPKTREFYQSCEETKVIKVEDQNSTDFTKAIKYLAKAHPDSARDIIVLGGIGGRLDQTFSTINSLFLGRRIYILDAANMVTLLQAGHHEIDCTGLGKHCGLVPLNKPVKCWSTGFEWCLHGETMELGGLISTNNRVVSKDHRLGVRCDGPVLFSIELT